MEQRTFQSGERKTGMPPPKKQLRIVVTQNSYRMAHRLRQILGLAEYEPRNVFEGIEATELLQILRESSPIHLVILTPTIISELEQAGVDEVLPTQFPDVALLFLGDEDKGWRTSRSSIIPDYVLVPPITADSLDRGIAAALVSREHRLLAMEYIAQGEAAMKVGSFTEAQRNFEAAVQIGGPDPYACLALGDLFRAMGDTEQAIAFFDQALQKDPSYFEAVHRIVELLLSRGERPQAIPHLENAAAVGTAPVESVVLLGALYLEAGLVEQADSQLRSACHTGGSRAISAIQEQAQHLAEHQAISEAITLLRIGIAAQPENTQLYQTLGDLFMQQNNLRDAVACYENLTKLGEPFSENYCRLARAYMALGFNLRAEKAVQQALKLEPESAEAAELRIAVAS
jgi:tetratricopeptide (TPR) repeat protein